MRKGYKEGDPDSHGWKQIASPLDSTLQDQTRYEGEAPTAEWAITLIHGYRDGTIAFDGFYRAIYDLSAHFAALYPDPGEVDEADLMAQFQMFALVQFASAIAHGHEESEVLAYLEEWLPHLESGEAAWRTSVEGGHWPFDTG
jgi:hypothetical protein